MNSLVNRLLSAALRFFFFLLYNPFAWAYDWVSAIVSLNQWQDWIRCIVPYLSGERILELGHGPGHLQVVLQQPGCKVYGIDLSRAMGKQALSRLKAADLPARLVRGKGQSLPYKAECFDQVFSTFPSEYLFQPATLSEIYRVLAPGGLLVVLPFAWIRRGSTIESSLAWLFHVTHQAPCRQDAQWQSDLVEPFGMAGFSVRTEVISLPSSEVYVVLAGKPKML
jgi:ubiquinone/menaquinone biosynthesis C-methylase UbiE